MKVLVVTPLYEPVWKAGGGVVSCLSALCRGLVKSGISATVYTTNASGTETFLNVPLETPIDLGGVKVFYFRSTFGPSSPFHSGRLTRKLKETICDFDIVYVVALWQWIGVATVHICYHMKIPVIIGIHGGFAKILRRKSFLKKKLFKLFFLDRAMSRASAIHLTSENERNTAGDWLDKYPVMIVPNAVDNTKISHCPEMRAKFRTRYDIPQTSPVLISVGRPDWKKRIDLLIGAVSRTEDWYLVFVGDQTSGRASDWKDLSRQLKVDRRVIWTGFL